MNRRIVLLSSSSSPTSYSRIWTLASSLRKYCRYMHSRRPLRRSKTGRVGSSYGASPTGLLKLRTFELSRFALYRSMASCDATSLAGLISDLVLFCRSAKHQSIEARDLRLWLFPPLCRSHDQATWWTQFSKQLSQLFVFLGKPLGRLPICPQS